MRSELGDTKQSDGTFKCFQLLAAANGSAGRCHSQDVGKASGGRGCAEKNKVGGDAFGGASRNDAIVLWQVRDQETDKNDAAMCLLGPGQDMKWEIGEDGTATHMETVSSM